MVFVYVPHARRRTVGATREELEKLRELRSHGLEGESLERALVTSGIPPERARLLVEEGGAPSPEGVARGIGAALAVTGASHPLQTDPVAALDALIGVSDVLQHTAVPLDGAPGGFVVLVAGDQHFVQLQEPRLVENGP